MLGQKYDMHCSYQTKRQLFKKCFIREKKKTLEFGNEMITCLHSASYKQICKSANLLMHYQPVNALDAGDMGLLTAVSPTVLVARTPLGLLSLVPELPPKVRFNPNRSAELVLLLLKQKKTMC